MNNYDFRPACERCKGEGGWVSGFCPCSGKYERVSETVWVVTCYKCDGEGKTPMTETVQIESPEATLKDEK